MGQDCRVSKERKSILDNCSQTNIVEVTGQKESDEELQEGKDEVVTNG